MNVLMKAMDEVKFNIPYEVLNIFFGNSTNNAYHAPITMEERIAATVIRPRVMMDMNMVGGQSIEVPIGDLNPTIYDYYTLLYHIPPIRVAHKKIISVLSVNYMPYFGNMGPISSLTGHVAGGHNDLAVAGMKVGMSYSSVPSLSTATAEIVGDNTILIRDTTRLSANYILRCIVENDENLNNLTFKSIRKFAELCVLAVKSYIYTNAYVKIDKAFLEFGQELGAVKNYIDTLQDAEEKYQTYLKTSWSKSAYMSNKKEYFRLIRSQVSPGI